MALTSVNLTYIELFGSLNPKPFVAYVGLLGSLEKLRRLRQKNTASTYITWMESSSLLLKRGFFPSAPLPNLNLSKKLPELDT